MYQLILVIHVFVAICLVGLVLIQQGKGATVGSAFGSGASQTVFGSRGSGSFLLKVTISFVGIFFLTSVGLNYMASQMVKQQKQIELPVPVQQPTTGAGEIPMLPMEKTQQPVGSTGIGKEKK